MPVGTEVKVIGRVQSRAYEKKHDDGTVEQKVAYEVSISNLEVIDEKKKLDELAALAQNTEENSDFQNQVEEVTTTSENNEQ